MSTNPKVGSTPKLIVTITEGGAAKNISGADVKKIFLRNPDGVAILKTAEFTTDGKNGKIEYKCTTEDLDMAGIWRIQGYVELGTDVWPSDGAFFTVDENIILILRGAGQIGGFSTVTGTGTVAA